MADPEADPRAGLLAALLASGAGWLPERFRTENARLFAPEHLRRLAARLLSLHEHGVPTDRPAPHFAAECTPTLGGAREPFRAPVAAWTAAHPDGGPEWARVFAAAMESAGTDSLLLLLGQRRTPASLADCRAIPPTRAELLESASREHGGGLSVAARALAKHAARHDRGFWGAVAGSAADKNRQAITFVERILDGTTWWNVFGHPAHGTAFEARLPSGHGARWALPGPTFVGFLEPFLDRSQA